jgi:Heparinase II/III-like protein
VERWAFAFKRGAARLACRAFPQLAADALAMDAARFVSPGIPALFSRDLREIVPTLNEDLLDLYGRSELVLANQFAFLNHSETLAGDFDWELHESPGWRRELHAFDYGLDLAMTYRISQESRYALHLRYLIAHWIAENPGGQGTGWELEPVARRVRNWILAADLTRQNWEGDAQFLAILGRSLAMQCAFLNRHASSPLSPECAAQVARALLLASNYFGGTGGVEFAEKGGAILAGAVRAALDGDGVPSRLRPVAFFEVAEACVEYLVHHPPAEGPERTLDARSVRRLLAVLEGALMPDGTLPLFGPAASSRVDELSDLFAVAAVLLEEPAWKKLAGKFGIVPYLLLGERGKLHFERMAETPWAPGSRAVPELGLCRLGSGDRSALMINARPTRLPEEHQDYLSYELSHQGHRVVVDSGAYSPKRETWDKYFPSARAHNVLLIDGLSPRPRSQNPAEAADADWIISEGCRGICFQDDGFDFMGIHRHRAFYTLGDGAWAVLDRLAGTGRRRLLNLIHLFPTFQIEKGSDRAIIRSRSMRMTVIPLGMPLTPGMSSPAIKDSRGPHPDRPGYFSPDVGVKFASGVLAFEAGEIALPWLGGYLILPWTEADFSAGNVHPREGHIEFGLAGINYRLLVG